MQASYERNATTVVRRIILWMLAMLCDGTGMVTGDMPHTPPPHCTLHIVYCIRYSLYYMLYVVPALGKWLAMQ